MLNYTRKILSECTQNKMMDLVILIILYLQIFLELTNENSIYQSFDI